MGKRSSFERIERDFYPTPVEAVRPLLSHLAPGTRFVEPDSPGVRHQNTFGVGTLEHCHGAAVLHARQVERKTLREPTRRPRATGVLLKVQPPGGFHNEALERRPVLEDLDWNRVSIESLADEAGSEEFSLHNVVSGQPRETVSWGRYERVEMLTPCLRLGHAGKALPKTASSCASQQPRPAVEQLSFGAGE